VAAHAIAEREGITVDQAETRLKADSATLTTAAYKWLAPDELKSYFIVVDKPYWLLRTAVSGDAVIWVPKSITRTECIRKPKESL
jgi:putative heme iron utilization protein